MAIQFSTGLRNARLDQIEATVGTTPFLRQYTGSMPANCAAAATGTKCVEMTLPSDWMNDASGGSKTMKGTWSASAIASGTLGYYRIYDSGDTTCHEQGTITATGGGGDMTVDNTNVAINQVVTVTSFTKTDGNA
jgi:hypothetical protein